MLRRHFIHPTQHTSFMKYTHHLPYFNRCVHLPSPLSIRHNHVLLNRTLTPLYIHLASLPLNLCSTLTLRLNLSTLSHRLFTYITPNASAQAQTVRAFSIHVQAQAHSSALLHSGHRSTFHPAFHRFEP